MSENINIAARRIFNKLSEDISDRRGIGDEWDQISPNVKSVEIRREWEQIFTEEIEKHTTELQARVNRLEEALDLVLKMRADWLEMQEDGYAGAYYAFVKGNDDEWDSIIKAKESKI